MTAAYLLGVGLFLFDFLQRLRDGFANLRILVRPEVSQRANRFLGLRADLPEPFNSLDFHVVVLVPQATQEEWQNLFVHLGIRFCDGSQRLKAPDRYEMVTVCIDAEGAGLTNSLNGSRIIGRDFRQRADVEPDCAW